MKALLYTAMIGLVCLNLPVEKDEPTFISGTNKPVAVLELFTSEGCHNCPLADEMLPLLGKLDPHTITLAFHVDYWNKLGWKDRFSSPVYTERQRRYGAVFQLPDIYTPQLVINGKYEQLGSNRDKAAETIREVVKEKAAVTITVNNVKLDNRQLSFDVATEGDLKKTDLLAILVQKDASTQVEAGENKGEKLVHTNIVRVMEKKEGAAMANFTLTLPEDLEPGNWSLVILTQRQKNMYISGAVLYNPS